MVRFPPDLYTVDMPFQVERHVSDAKEHGARVVCGGKMSELGGSFYEPTVLADATNDMSVSQEETFGPVAPVIRYVDSFVPFSLPG